MRRVAAGVLLVAALLAPSAARSLDIGHTRLPEWLRLGPDGAELVLNGAGLRSRLRFEIYVIGLYLPERRHTDESVLAQAGAKRVRIVMLRDVSAKQMTEALVGVMQKNNPPAELAAARGGIEEFRALLLSIPRVPTGTVFDIDYLPASGTRLAVDGIPKGAPIPGAAFYRAVLRIWIGDKPEQPGLKDALLGG
ncbi:MAG TPA: chalcone isomerase family protein [Burkholderiales bacterium]